MEGLRFSPASIPTKLGVPHASANPNQASPLYDIYLDHAAATPLRPQVRKAMAEAEEQAGANPSGVHRRGREARRTLERARGRMGELLGVSSRCIYFVRGGTEANNLAVLGRADRVRTGGSPPLMVSTPVEHSSVRGAVERVAQDHGSEASLPVQPSGQVEASALRELLDRGPALVSIQRVNHETGSVLSVPRVVRACREREIPLHSDMVQAVGRIALGDPDLLPDLVSFSAHKLGGPRSMGALVVKDRDLLVPRLFGGGQEGGLRPGTEDVIGAAGFAAALELALNDLPEEASRLGALRQELEEGLREKIPELVVHGSEGPRAPHILNVGVPGLSPDLLPRALDLEGIAASAGSACRSGSTTMSPVLAGFYGAERAASVAPLRLSLGWTTAPEDIQRAMEIIPDVVERVRSAMRTTNKPHRP